MERNEVSIQEAKTYKLLRDMKTWTTSKELFQKLKGTVGAVTIRVYMLKFVKLGLSDLAEVHPGHRYRISDKASKRNAAYVQRLEQAIEVFGLEAKEPSTS